MSEENKPQEFWMQVEEKNNWEFMAVSNTMVWTKEPPEYYSGEKVHVIEYSAYKNIKNKHEELLSYLPKVPTQPYEKQLAEDLENLKREMEQVKHLYNSKCEELDFEKNISKSLIETLDFYANRDSWKPYSVSDDCKDCIISSDLGVKSYSDKADYALPSGGRRAREILSKIKIL